MLSVGGKELDLHISSPGEQWVSIHLRYGLIDQNDQILRLLKKAIHSYEHKALEDEFRLAENNNFDIELYSRRSICELEKYNDHLIIAGPLETELKLPSAGYFEWSNFDAQVCHWTNERPRPYVERIPTFVPQIICDLLLFSDLGLATELADGKLHKTFLNIARWRSAKISESKAFTKALATKIQKKSFGSLKGITRKQVLDLFKERSLT